ncbi:MAG: hypothetical protein PHI59_06030, partial [Candidatus Omnitrophica bacterium]|nr:hypothetical protein [Candidatus Omnitrophota bacterium]
FYERLPADLKKHYKVPTLKNINAFVVLNGLIEKYNLLGEEEFFLRYGSITGDILISRDLGLDLNLHDLHAITGSGKALRELFKLKEKGDIAKFEDSANWHPRAFSFSSQTVAMIIDGLIERYDSLGEEGFFLRYGSVIGGILISSDLELGVNISDIHTIIGSGEALRELFKLKGKGDIAGFEDSANWHPRLFHLPSKVIGTVIDGLIERYDSLGEEGFFLRYGSIIGDILISRDLGLDIHLGDLHTITGSSEALRELFRLRGRDDIEGFEDSTRWHPRLFKFSSKVSEMIINGLIQKYDSLGEEGFFLRYGSVIGDILISRDLGLDINLGNLHTITGSGEALRELFKLEGRGDIAGFEDSASWRPRSFNLPLQTVRAVIDGLIQKYDSLGEEGFFLRYGSVIGDILISRDFGLDINLGQLSALTGSGKALRELFRLEGIGDIPRFENNASWYHRKFGLPSQTVRTVIDGLIKKYDLLGEEEFFLRYGSITGDILISRDLGLDVNLNQLHTLTGSGEALREFFKLEGKGDIPRFGNNTSWHPKHFAFIKKNLKSILRQWALTLIEKDLPAFGQPAYESGEEIIMIRYFIRELDSADIYEWFGSYLTAGEKTALIDRIERSSDAEEVVLAQLETLASDEEAGRLLYSFSENHRQRAANLLNIWYLSEINELAEIDGALDISNVIQNYDVYYWKKKYSRNIPYGFLNYIEREKAKAHARIKYGIALDKEFFRGDGFTLYDVLGADDPGSAALLAYDLAIVFEGLGHTPGEITENLAYMNAALLQESQTPEEIAGVLGWSNDKAYLVLSRIKEGCAEYFTNGLNNISVDEPAERKSVGATIGGEDLNAIFSRIETAVQDGRVSLISYDDPGDFGEMFLEIVSLFESRYASTDDFGDTVYPDANDLKVYSGAVINGRIEKNNLPDEYRFIYDEADISYEVVDLGSGVTGFNTVTEAAGGRPVYAISRYEETEDGRLTLRISIAKGFIEKNVGDGGYDVIAQLIQHELDETVLGLTHTEAVLREAYLNNDESAPLSTLTMFNISDISAQGDVNYAKYLLALINNTDSVISEYENRCEVGIITEEVKNKAVELALKIKEYAEGRLTPALLISLIKSESGDTEESKEIVRNSCQALINLGETDEFYDYGVRYVNPETLKVIAEKCYGPVIAPITLAMNFRLGVIFARNDIKENEKIFLETQGGHGTWIFIIHHDEYLKQYYQTDNNTIVFYDLDLNLKKMSHICSADISERLFGFTDFANLTPTEVSQLHHIMQNEPEGFVTDFKIGTDTYKVHQTAGGVEVWKKDGSGIITIARYLEANSYAREDLGSSMGVKFDALGKNKELSAGELMARIQGENLWVGDDSTLKTNLQSFAYGTNENASRIGARLVELGLAGTEIRFFTGLDTLAFRQGNIVWLNEWLAEANQANAPPNEMEARSVILEGLLTHQTEHNSTTGTLFEEYEEEVAAVTAECEVYKNAVNSNLHIKSRMSNLLDNRFNMNAIIVDDLLETWKEEPSSPSTSYIVDSVASHYDEYSVFNYSLLHPAYVGHDIAVCNVVNPTHETGKVAVYGGAGADISNFLLSTDATEAYFVNVNRIDHSGLETAVLDWDNIGEGYSDIAYSEIKRKNGYGDINTLMGLEAWRVIQELKAMKAENVRVIETSNTEPAQIKFEWQYPGASEKKTYTITFITADITKPDEYPQKLNDVLDGGIDVYYQRAGMDIPKKYASFMPRIGSSVKNGGYAITDDECGYSDGRFNPQEYLEKDGVVFTHYRELQSSSVQKWGNIIYAGMKHNNYGWNVCIRQQLWDKNDLTSVMAFLEREVARDEPDEALIEEAVALFNGTGCNTIDIHDSEGRIVRSYVEYCPTLWESYTYDGTGAVSVTLYNSATGSYFSITSEPGNSELNIMIPGTDGHDIKIGYFKYSINAEAIEFTRIEINSDAQGFGFGKAIIQWLALTAARAGKELRIIQAITPKAAHLYAGLYDYDTLTVTRGAERGEDDAVEISGLNPESVETILLKGTFQFHVDFLQYTFEVLDPVAGVIDISNLPLGYRAYIEDMRIIVEDPNGARLDSDNVRYTPESELYWYGMVDTDAIVEARRDDLLRQLTETSPTPALLISLIESESADTDESTEIIRNAYQTLISLGETGEFYDYGVHYVNSEVVRVIVNNVYNILVDGYSKLAVNLRSGVTFAEDTLNDDEKEFIEQQDKQGNWLFCCDGMNYLKIHEENKTTVWYRANLDFFSLTQGPELAFCFGPADFGDLSSNDASILHHIMQNEPEGFDAAFKIGTDTYKVHQVDGGIEVWKKDGSGVITIARYLEANGYVREDLGSSTDVKFDALGKNKELSAGELMARIQGENLWVEDDTVLKANLQSFATGTNENAPRIEARLVELGLAGAEIRFFTGLDTLAFRQGNIVWLNEWLAEANQANAPPEMAIILEGLLAHQTKHNSTTGSLLEEFT